MSEKQAVRFLYVNWKGERADRHVLPIRIWYGKTNWHPELQWFLQGFDLGKQELRDFALDGIIGWHELKGRTPVYDKKPGPMNWLGAPAKLRERLSDVLDDIGRYLDDMLAREAQPLKTRGGQLRARLNAALSIQTKADPTRSIFTHCGAILGGNVCTVEVTIPYGASAEERESHQGPHRDDRSGNEWQPWAMGVVPCLHCGTPMPPATLLSKTGPSAAIKRRLCDVRLDERGYHLACMPQIPSIDPSNKS